MKKAFALVLAALLVLTFSLSGCNNKDDDNDPLLTLCELSESQEKEIGNQIPQWVSDADWALPLNVMTSTDLDKFDDYARRIFPSYYDDGWTQEQSDKVYLGQGIEMYALDDVVPECRIVYYPVILNGVVVSGLQVYEDSGSHDLGWQAGPHYYYILDIDHMEHKEVDTKVIPIKEVTGDVVDAMEPLCAERTASWGE